MNLILDNSFQADGRAGRGCLSNYLIGDALQIICFIRDLRLPGAQQQRPRGRSGRCGGLLKFI